MNIFDPNNPERKKLEETVNDLGKKWPTGFAFFYFTEDGQIHVGSNVMFPALPVMIAEWLKRQLMSTPPITQKLEEIRYDA